jgi:uncharacterized protein (TIGR02687 family)
MNIKQLQQGLENKFAKSRIVFWHDPDQSFTEELDQLSLDGISIINMGDESHFEVKKRIEFDESTTQFLLYYPSEVPKPELDWLLDIREYSDTFFADMNSLILNDLGISQMSLRGYIQSRMKFFGNKQRVEKFKRRIVENETEVSLDKKMISVLVKADSANVNDLTLSALSLLLIPEGETLLDDLKRYGLTKSFWQVLNLEYGYVSDTPTLNEFLLRLFCTELWAQTEKTDRSWLEPNLLAGASGKANAIALMKFWRHHNLFKSNYIHFSMSLEQQLDVMTRYASNNVESLLEAESFEGLEKVIIRALVSSLSNPTGDLNRAWFDQVISSRMTSFWVGEKFEYKEIYSAIRQAVNLIELRERFNGGFYYESASEMYKAYSDELFKFDQAYRLFNEHAELLFSKGSDILRLLDEQVENIYTNWFLPNLSMAWDDKIESASLMEEWQLDKVPHQADFYQGQVSKLLKTTQLKRIFVVISDAFRYEVAEEFVECLNEKKQFKAELSSQLGVLPSYTQLGMAALLPHQKLSYSDKGSAVLVDGVSSQGTGNRKQILSKVNGLAVSSKELLAWTSAEGREMIKDYEVVYIYHNTIDDICDKQGGEDRTPKVCRDAINELIDLMGRVINRLNASRVLLTADHGFLFQKQPLDSSDKTKSVKVESAIEAKKRYIVGHNLPSHELCWKGQIKNTAHGSDETEFLLPKGVQRFHFVGGAKFVHGGASLQEVCVPLISIRELEGKRITEHQKLPVGVVVVTQPIKFVNNLEKIKLLQSDSVGLDNKARELELYVEDQNSNVVSTKERILFDSREEKFDARIKEVRIKLTGQHFDRNQFYQLVLLDVATNTVYAQYAVQVDLAIHDEFI